jgi:acyl-CoA reductase-like NAD-dependent aldehyde dehydrogenase
MTEVNLCSNQIVQDWLEQAQSAPTILQNFSQETIDQIIQGIVAAGAPADGSSAGNVPAWIEPSANIPKAIADIFFSKTLSYGTGYAAEQAIVCDRAIQAPVMAECARRGGCFLSPAEQEQLTAVMFVDGAINPQVVGQSAIAIARLAEISIPASTRVLIAPLTVVGADTPLSGAKQSPVLAFYSVDGREAAVDRLNALLELGGLGQVMALHTADQTLVATIGDWLSVQRCLINTPAAVGAVGYTTEFTTPQIGLEVRPIHDAAGRKIGASGQNSQVSVPFTRRSARQASEI